MLSVKYYLAAFLLYTKPVHNRKLLNFPSVLIQRMMLKINSEEGQWRLRYCKEKCHIMIKTNPNT